MRNIIAKDEPLGLTATESERWNHGTQLRRVWILVKQLSIQHLVFLINYKLLCSPFSLGQRTFNSFPRMRMPFVGEKQYTYISTSRLRYTPLMIFLLSVRLRSLTTCIFCKSFLFLGHFISLFFFVGRAIHKLNTTTLYVRFNYIAYIYLIYDFKCTRTCSSSSIHEISCPWN